jgi:hypothetical protein
VFLHAETTEQRLVLYSPRAGTDTGERLAALLGAVPTAT